MAHEGEIVSSVDGGAVLYKPADGRPIFHAAADYSVVSDGCAIYAPIKIIDPSASAYRGFTGAVLAAAGLGEAGDECFMQGGLPSFSAPANTRPIVARTGFGLSFAYVEGYGGSTGSYAFEAVSASQLFNENFEDQGYALADNWLYENPGSKIRVEGTFEIALNNGDDGRPDILLEWYHGAATTRTAVVRLRAHYRMSWSLAYSPIFGGEMKTPFPSLPKPLARPSVSDALAEWRRPATGYGNWKVGDGTFDSFSIDWAGKAGFSTAGMYDDADAVSAMRITA